MHNPVACWNELHRGSNPSGQRTRFPRMSFTTLSLYTCQRCLVTHMACSSASVGRRDSVLCSGAKFSDPSLALMSNRDTMANSTAVFATVVAEWVACDETWPGGRLVVS